MVCLLQGHFREALAAGLPNAEQHQEAVLGLAEVLQQAASTITQVGDYPHLACCNKHVTYDTIQQSYCAYS